MDAGQRLLYVINFGRKLSPNIITQIENEVKCIVNEEQVRVNINLSKNIYIQIVEIINAIQKDLLDGTKKIAINLPGLPIASVYLIVEMHARLGYFPLVLELYRSHTDDKVFSDFEFKKLVDLQYERDISRSKLFGS